MAYKPLWEIFKQNFLGASGIVIRNDSQLPETLIGRLEQTGRDGESGSPIEICGVSVGSIIVHKIMHLVKF